jgi:peptidoglycan/LPS O-acetylase OafA/YrhL
MTQLTPHPNLYFKSIDRYRFIAFFLVFIYHCFIYFKPVFNSIEEQNQFFVLQYFLTFVNESGDLGVNFFFTLSGFLISFLLLKEQENRSKIHLVSFYMRRILRIWPLYFLSIILGFIILPLLFPAVYSSSNSICIGWYALFLGNVDVMLHGYPPPVLGVLWSISIEEQFYLLWPLGIALLPKKLFPWICFTGILVSFAYNMHSTDIHRKFHTLMAVQYLSMGGLFAYIKHKSLLPIFEKITNTKWVMVGLFFILFLYTYKWIFLNIGVPYYAYRPYVSIFLSVFFASWILRLTKVSTNISSFFSFLGKISYSLYIWHMFVVVCVQQIPIRFLSGELISDFFLKTILTLGISIAVSSVSYFLIEKPILSLKARFS